MPRKLTTEEFIRRAKEIHKDENGNPLYDYSESVYINARSKLKIKCLKCGNIFYQTPDKHINKKSGCPVCAIKRRANKKRKSIEQFIKEAEKVHGRGKYDYSEVEYKRRDVKVKIKCNQCGNYFWQTPAVHIYDKCGCPYCYGNIRKTTEQFIEEAKKIHKDRYDYSLVEYKNARTKVKIFCKIHNIIFEQTPDVHLKGAGCPLCGKESQIEKQRLTKEEFIEKAEKIHKDENGNPLYDYSEVIYVNNRTKVKIKCLKCGNNFEQTPAHHLIGNGCPYCASYGFNFDKPAILYYLKIYHNDSIYYKIGITNRTINERFYPKERMKIEVLKVWKFDKGVDAYKKEQEILKKYRRFRYNGNKNILRSGNTELFIKDVLNLDREDNNERQD